MKLDSPIFTDADTARDHLEAQRWPNGPICPHCGTSDQTRSAMKGKAHRPGLYKCNECRGQFTVTVGTVFERSKDRAEQVAAGDLPHGSSKKGMSAHQLHRMLGVTYKTAWFMAHRIREAMKDDVHRGPLGGEGKIVEADETYIGKRETPRKPSPQRSGRPFTKSARLAAHRSASLSALSSVAARPACSMSNTPRPQTCATCWSATSTAHRRSTPTKAASTPRTGEEYRRRTAP